MPAFSSWEIIATAPLGFFDAAAVFLMILTWR